MSAVSLGISKAVGLAIDRVILTETDIIISFFGLFL